MFDFIYNEKLAVSRFGFYVYDKGKTGKFFFNLPAPSREEKWYSSFGNADNKGWTLSDDSMWNQTVPNKFNLGETIYLTMVFDGSGEMEYLYVNGENTANVSIDKSYWQGFMDDFDKKKINSILLGAGNMSNIAWWHLTKMDCYAIRLYSKALTDKEVLENYNMTVSYHEFLEKGDNSVVDSN